MMNMAGGIPGINIGIRYISIVSAEGSLLDGFMKWIHFFMIVGQDYILFHVYERAWSDVKYWEDPDYPFDWTEGEFC